LKSDREAVIVGCAMVEKGLEAALLRAFVELSKTERQALFEGTGPLASFSAKIKIANAIGTIGDDARNDLDRIRDVRNAFAHSILDHLDFDTLEIKQACDKILFPQQVKEIASGIDKDFEIESPKGKFLMAVTLYGCCLLAEPSADESQRPASPDKPAR
jgi:DNA-binding MltR family transcriptional regulator